MSDKKITAGKKKLGVAELMCYGIGNCIGSGIFVSMGSGIGFTGRSIPLALIIACVVVLFAYAYKTMMSGMFVLPGGNYSQQALLQPPILIGVSAISTIFTGNVLRSYHHRRAGKKLPCRTERRVRYDRHEYDRTDPRTDQAVWKNNCFGQGGSGHSQRQYLWPGGQQRRGQDHIFENFIGAGICHFGTIQSLGGAG